MKAIIMPLTLGAVISLASPQLLANSNIFNDTPYKISAIWTAAGCAGQKSHMCDDKGIGYSVACKRAYVTSGESDDYHFKDGTSGRKMTAIACIDGKAKSDSASTGNKGEKKRCVARIKSDGKFGLKCGYSQSQYQQIKSDFANN